jgi:hypothetical protein
MVSTELGQKPNVSLKNFANSATSSFASGEIGVTKAMVIF